jgi:steroid delta-isomerase-like uncharacterized protein
LRDTVIGATIDNSNVSIQDAEATAGDDGLTSSLLRQDSSGSPEHEVGWVITGDVGKGATSMSAADNEAIGRRFFAEQDRLKGQLTDELCGERYTAEINGFPAMDRAGHNAMAVGFYSAFPDMHQTIEDTVADDDSVAMRFRAQGTHQGEFMGMPATGKPIDVIGTAIVRIEDGKVVSLKEVIDLQALQQQLGGAG